MKRPVELLEALLPDDAPNGTSTINQAAAAIVTCLQENPPDPESNSTNIAAHPESDSHQRK